MFAHLILNDFKGFYMFFKFDIGHQDKLEKITPCKYFFYLKAHNIFVKGKKQVGEHVKKSPEPKR